ncbi:MAG: alpha-2-macroglobulin family protein [Myxococcota bacterium]
MRWLLIATGCSNSAPELAQVAAPDEAVLYDMAALPAANEAEIEEDLEALQPLGGGGGLGQSTSSISNKLAPRRPPAASAPPADGAKGGQAEPPARAWFPEAFLWRPLVETGDDGVAEVDVRVPDQLSGFRVLALAHDRQGQQAGTTHRFQTRLPVYVDPVVPDRLFTGDRIDLPVQVVNGTSEPHRATVDITSDGALSGSGTADVALTAGGSDVRRIRLVARGAGSATLRAEVEAGPYADAAERTLTVLPTGRPVVQTQSRRLSPTPFILTAPPGADPTTERIDVVVFGGPWSVLEAEVERLAAGARPVDPAYGFALSAHVVRFAEASGVPFDEARQKQLRVQAWQRIAQMAQAPSHGFAADLLTALDKVQGDELVDALKPRLVRQVVNAQRTDGTWSRTERSTLQQVLVQTAVAARVLPTDERGARLRASGAIERGLGSIEDPFTASVVLAADLVPEDARPPLQTRIREAVEEGLVKLPEGVHNAQGGVPSPAEAVAWAVLALDADDDLGGELVSSLLGMWRADQGFGAGAANGVALDAIARALPPQEGPVALTLRRGDQTVGSARLDPTQPRVPARFELTPESPGTTLSIGAEPPAPGVVVVATRRSYVPWRSNDRIPGVDLDVELRGLEVGRAGEWRVAIAAPSGASVEVRQPLPAGVRVPSVSAPPRATVRSFADEVVVRTAPFQPGEVIEVSVPVVATFAGRFATGPLAASVDGGPSVAMAPAIWSVAP